MCKLHSCHPDNLCYWCRNKAKPKTMLKRTPLKPSQKKIKPRSDKRKEENRVYLILRMIFLALFPICECCKKRASEDVHHKRGRGKWFLVVEFWLAVCRKCHIEITKMPIEEAIKQGLSTRRNTSITERIK